ncbi:MAG: hypothetical protein AAF739_16900 [Pseudomonadota bacterium]
MRIIAMIACLIATPAFADDQLNLASELGRMLAFEEFCGLHYRYNALVDFTQENVDPDNVDFNTVLQASFRARSREREEMTAAMLIIQCTQIEQTARSFGFIE